MPRASTGPFGAATLTVGGALSISPACRTGVAPSSNGKTTDSESVNRGSNPRGASSRPALSRKFSPEDVGRALDRRDAALAALPIELDDEVHDRTDVGDRVQPREAEAALHHHQRELLQRPGRRVGVDGAERARVTGVDRPEEAHSFAAAELAKDDAVRAKTKSRLKQIVGRHAGLARFAFHGD